MMHHHEEIYLTLSTTPDGASSSVAVPYADAVEMDRKAFARLYRKTVYKSSRREALAWADVQIEKRAAAYSAASAEAL